MFCISGAARGRIWLPEDSVFGWNWKTHPSILQVFPAYISFPATHLPSTLSWPRAYGEIWTVSHLHSCIKAPSAIKLWTTTENVGLLCICWKIENHQKPCSWAPNLTSRPNMNEQPGWCVFLKCFSLLLRFWSYCVRSCRPILWPQFSSGSCSQAKEVTFPRGASCDGQRHVLPVSKWQGVQAPVSSKTICDSWQKKACFVVIYNSRLIFFHRSNVGFFCISSQSLEFRTLVLTECMLDKVYQSWFCMNNSQYSIIKWK